MNEKEKREIYGDLLKLAAEMLGRNNMPSPVADDWDLPQSTSQRTWYKILLSAGKADEQARAWGVRVGEIADRVIGRKQ